jgi:PII-like signaling protein
MNGGFAMQERFQARMLRIHFGEDDKWQGKPLHESIVAKCVELGIAGATVYRGIEGYGASTRIRHASHWKFSTDAPVMLSIIDTEEQIDRAYSAFGRDGARGPGRHVSRRGNPLLTCNVDKNAGHALRKSVTTDAGIQDEFDIAGLRQPSG